MTPTSSTSSWRLRRLRDNARALIVIVFMVLAAVVALNGRAIASTGPAGPSGPYCPGVYCQDPSGGQQQAQCNGSQPSSSDCGTEAAGAIEAVRKYWALPVLAALSGIATIIGVIGLLFQGDKKDLFEKVFTYGGIAFLGTAFSTIIVVAIKVYARHVQGIILQ